MLEAKRQAAALQVASVDTGKVLTPSEVYAQNVNSTVGITTSITTNYFGYQTTSAAAGSGFILTQDGYILTNYHVVEGSNSIKVTTYDGTSYDAQLIGYDESNDIAVLKIDATDLTPVVLGDSDTLNVGDTVVAIGNPLGVELRGTLTDGIVSAINRDVYVDGVTMTLIQTNAALNNGNSGGPLINVYGQVVGINTMKMGSSSTTSVEGLGFAIPIASTAYMINDLIAYGEVHGEVVIGISVQIAPVILDSGETALRVMDVTPGGPGEEAGIQEGDLIVAADGEALTKSTDLLRVRRRHEAGETLKLLVERDGKRFTADVVLRESDT